MLATLLLVAAPASAAPPQTGGGSGDISPPVITSQRDAGTNSVQTRLIEGTLEGTLDGTFVEEVHGVVHGNGTVTFHGTLTARLQGRGQAGEMPQTVTHLRIVNQSSNSIGVIGGAVVRQNGLDLDYTVEYRCT